MTLIAISADSELLAVATGPHVILANLRTGKVKAERDESRVHSGTVRCVAFSARSRSLASCADDKCAKIWDAEGRLLFSRQTSKKPSACTFTSISSPQGASEEVLLVGDKTGDVRAYSVGPEEGRSKLILGHTASIITALAMAEGETLLLSADRDEKVRVSHFPRTSNIHSFCLGHKQFISSMILPPAHPSVLLTASGDTTIRLWDFKAGKELHKEELPQEAVDESKRKREEEEKWSNWWEDRSKTIPSCMAFCPNSRLLAVGTYAKKQLFFYQLAADGSSLSPLSSDVECPATIGGVQFDCEGNLFVLLSAEPFFMVFRTEVQEGELGIQASREKGNIAAAIAAEIRRTATEGAEGAAAELDMREMKKIKLKNTYWGGDNA